MNVTYQFDGTTYSFSVQKEMSVAAYVADIWEHLIHEHPELRDDPFLHSRIQRVVLACVWEDEDHVDLGDLLEWPNSRHANK